MKDKSKGRECSPSLDRVNIDKGYIKGNIAVISNRANRIKSDATIEEIKALYEYMVYHKDQSNESV